MAATPTPQRNGPGVPPPSGVPTSKLKSIMVSGTDLFWALGEEHGYLDADGVPQKAEVIGMGILSPPKEQVARDGGVYLQINIIYPEYKDLWVVADHLVIKNLHVSPIAVPVAPSLVVPR